MIEEVALVTRVEAGQIFIKSLQTSACGGCSQQAGCSTATLAKILPKREFALDCDLNLQVGDCVRVQIDDSHLILSSMLLYLLPLIVTLTVVCFANTFLPMLENWLPEISMTTLLLTFWAIHHFHAPLLMKFSLKPQITGKI
ncbi:MAG: SoxR reducing system RseC family protein [Methylococcales bacterium]|nr:SoxR reducing system RseC family protein [Methylococcales bacterium]